MDHQNKTKKRQRAPRYKKRKPLTTCALCLSNDKIAVEQNVSGSPNFYKGKNDANGQVCTCTADVRCHDRTCLYYRPAHARDRVYDEMVARGELKIDVGKEA